MTKKKLTSNPPPFHSHYFRIGTCMLPSRFQPSVESGASALQMRLVVRKRASTAVITGRQRIRKAKSYGMASSACTVKNSGTHHPSYTFPSRLRACAPYYTHMCIMLPPCCCRCRTPPLSIDRLGLRNELGPCSQNVLYATLVRGQPMKARNGRSKRAWCQLDQV